MMLDSGNGLSLLIDHDMIMIGDNDDSFMRMSIMVD